MRVAGFAVLAFALGAIWAAALPVVAAPADIHLVCDGVATVEGQLSTSASGFDYQTGGTVNVHGTTSYPTNEADEILIDLTGDSGRIKLPARLTPINYWRRADDWWQFSSIKIDDTQIEGRLRLNFQKASVSINRMTGHIDMTEVGASFSGSCQRYDASAAVRKF